MKVNIDVFIQKKKSKQELNSLMLILISVFRSGDFGIRCGLVRFVRETNNLFAFQKPASIRQIQRKISIGVCKRDSEIHQIFLDFFF